MVEFTAEAFGFWIFVGSFVSAWFLLPFRSPGNKSHWFSKPHSGCSSFRCSTSRQWSLLGRLRAHIPQEGPLWMWHLLPGCGSWLNHISAPTAHLLWPFLYILSSVWTVLLVFILSSENVFLYSVVDFGVFVGGGKLGIFTLCHLVPAFWSLFLLCS